VGLDGDAAVRTTLDALAADRFATIFVTTTRIGGNNTNPAGPNAPGTQSIAPQIFPGGQAQAQGLTVAGRALTPPPLAVVSAPMGASSPGVPVARPQGGTVTQLIPRQVPIKEYLDGAEIADALTLKTGRLATTTTVRRRA
jgi:hypothetical protein